MYNIIKDLNSQILKGSIKEVESLINQKEDVNTRSGSSGNTPLHFTVIRNISQINVNTHPSLTIADLLLNNGAEINIRNKEGLSPLHYALLFGHLSIIRLFINKRYNETKIKAKEQIPSNSGILKQTFYIVDVLLKNKTNFNITPRDLITLLLFSVRYKDEKCFELILKEMNIFDINAFVPKSTSSILHKVAQIGTSKMIKDLIDNGAQIDQRDGNGDTPLICATKWGNSENVLCLLHHGASFHCTDLQGWTALHYLAEKESNKEVFQTILGKINFEDKKGLKDKKTPLFVACCRPSSDYGIVKLLIEHGADVNAKDRNGRTPLHAACLAGNIEKASYILKSGANINARCNQGENALHFAIRVLRRVDMIELLLRKGCDVNARNIFGQTPLFYIYRRKLSCNSDIIKLLVRYGADINARDKINDTVLHAICKNIYIFNFNVECYLESKADLNALNHENGLTPLEYVFNNFDQDYDYSKNNVLRGLISFIVKMEVENEYVSEKNLKLAKSFSFFVDYKLEIERMKKKKIVSSSYVCFFDFLTENVHRLAAFCRNQDIMRVLDCEDYLKDFPLYGYLLEKHIQEAKSKLSLIQAAEEILKNRLKCKLTHIIVDGIFRNLDDLDLKYFVEAFSKKL